MPEGLNESIVAWWDMDLLDINENPLDKVSSIPVDKIGNPIQIFGKINKSLLIYQNSGLLYLMTI
jgi:hypothetical protein